MSTIWRAVWHCDVCGHEWIKKPGEKPAKQCPSRKCRSRQWNKEGSAPLPAADVIAKLPIGLQPLVQPASSLPTPVGADECPHGFKTKQFCQTMNRGTKCQL
jgi:hypothetical protein